MKEGFYFTEDCFVYHLTEKKNMERIIVEGLRPKCGFRSKSVGDIRKAVYFFDDLSFVSKWIQFLYQEKDIQALELLRFNLKNRTWYEQCYDIRDFYILKPVFPEEIDYASETEWSSEEVKIKWKSLQSYNKK